MIPSFPFNMSTFIRFIWKLEFCCFEETLEDCLSESTSDSPHVFLLFLTSSHHWWRSPTFSGSMSLVSPPAATSSVSTWQMLQSSMTPWLQQSGAQFRLVGTDVIKGVGWVWWEECWVAHLLEGQLYLVFPRVEPLSASFAYVGPLGRVASFGSIPHLFFCPEECIIADSWKGTLPMAIVRLREEALRGIVGNKGRK